MRYSHRFSLPRVTQGTSSPRCPGMQNQSQLSLGNIWTFPIFVTSKLSCTGCSSPLGNVIKRTAHPIWSSRNTRGNHHQADDPGQRLLGLEWPVCKSPARVPLVRPFCPAWSGPGEDLHLIRSCDSSFHFFSARYWNQPSYSIMIAMMLSLIIMITMIMIITISLL